MARKNSSGWLVPAVILTLPCFMFYFWWSHLGRGTRKTALMGQSRKTSVRGLFNAAPPNAKLSNPISAFKPALATSQPPLPIKKRKPERLLALSPSTLGVSVKKSVAVASGIPDSPKIKRDPTLSPEDRREIKEMSAPKSVPRKITRRRSKKKNIPIERLIDLEGIIFVSPANVKAIVNGHIRRPGESVHGAKILSILQQKVIFSYNGRQFVKVMNGKL